MKECESNVLCRCVAMLYVLAPVVRDVHAQMAALGASVDCNRGNKYNIGWGACACAHCPATSWRSSMRQSMLYAYEHAGANL